MKSFSDKPSIAYVKYLTLRCYSQKLFQDGDLRYVKYILLNLLWKISHNDSCEYIFFQ